MLLEAGAESSFALRQVLEHSSHLPNGVFRRILWTLVENARSAPFHRSRDPVLSTMRSSKALSLHPKASEILLNRKIFTDIGLGRGAAHIYKYDSHMYHAINLRQHSVVDVLLQNGAMVDATVWGQNSCPWKRFESCTWITFSVLLGAAPCADVLIRHGADVTALDQSGRSASQLAKMNVLASHPRCQKWKWPENYFSVTAEEDAETLAIVERAFNDRFQGTKSLEDHIKSINELPVQPPLRRKILQSVFRKTVSKSLGAFLTASQRKLLRERSRATYHKIRNIWSLSFAEALLTRFLYILSYALLLCLEIRAIINGQRRVPIPSRSLLSAIAFLTLAIIWGSSYFGCSLGSSVAGSKVERDS